MYLTARRALPEDLPSVFAFFGRRLSIPAEDQEDVIRMWAHVMGEADYAAVLVEDHDMQEGGKTVAFALKYSVPRELMDFARTAAPPLLWRWTLARWRQGQQFWQGRGEARKLQAESGIHYFGFSGVDKQRYAGLEMQKVVDILTAAIYREFPRHRSLYNLVEAFGERQRDHMLALGMKVERDYGEYREKPESRGIPEENWPYLLMADYREASSEVNLTSVARVARLGQPKFGFSEAEQEVMKMALGGLTDQAIANQLGLTLVAIKKRWEGIYEKVNEESFRRAWERGQDGEAPGKMGRRQVLQMMAEHPEEFWPSPARKKAARG